MAVRMYGKLWEIRIFKIKFLSVIDYTSWTRVFAFICNI